jgi:hypothetical protein
VRTALNTHKQGNKAPSPCILWLTQDDVLY